MKKIISFLSAIALLTSSCSEKEAFTITGKLPSAEYDGQQVYLKTLDENWKDYTSIDTVNVVNGEFTFKGLAKNGSVLHFIVLDNAPDNMKRPVPVIVEPGQIQVTLDSVSTVQGTSSNNAYQTFISKSNVIDTELAELARQMKSDNANQADLRKQSDEKYDLLKKETYDFVKSNIQSQWGTYFFSRKSYMFSPDQLKELLASVNPELKSNKQIQRLETRVQALEATAVGKVFTDIKGKTPDGKDIALSEFAGKGKCVLINFWASWCPDCRVEMPELVEIYKQYKGKGFEIVGISLDQTNEAWQTGIKTLNITWPQISDLKRWDSELSATYGVASIPENVLLDKDGKIIARGINPHDLTTKLTEILK